MKGKIFTHADRNNGDDLNFECSSTYIEPQSVTINLPKLCPWKTC